MVAAMALEQDRKIAETVQAERARLRGFIRSRVANRDDAEDILQEVFYELIEAYRMMKPIEQVSAWLFRVARNRITDLFRKRKPEAFSEAVAAEDEGLQLEDMLPSPDAGPEAIFARGVLLEALDEALDQLPPEQRDVFVAHEIEGRSFKELAVETGLSVNTLLSRKRYAVLQLRKSLQTIYDDLIE